MRSGRLGSDFDRLWAAYASSSFGTGLAFGALPLIAVQVLHADSFEVSLLAAAGLAVGSVVALPLGPWIEFHRKRPLMVAMDLIRFVAMASIPVAFALGWLTFVQLLVVTIISATANIAFTSASGGFLKHAVANDLLIVANSRFEATTWTATAAGPPLGGLLISVFGQVTTVIANAISYLVSASALLAISGREPRPARPANTRLRFSDITEGWRFILSDGPLRSLFLNTTAVNGLIMATDPLLAVLLLGQFGFEAWQYGLALGLPCLGGLLGSRLAPRLVARFGPQSVLYVSGILRVCWPVALVFAQPGLQGLLTVIAVEFALIASIAVFNPVFATYRLQRLRPEQVARALTAWRISGNVTIALLTATWGVLASFVGAHAAIVLAGVALLATPALLYRRGYDL
ncbi:MFS transporter [Nocardioides hungaricus]